MKASGICDRLKKVGVRSVVIGPGNGCVLSNRECRNRLWEGEVWIQVRVMAAASIPRPPTRVQREFHEMVSRRFPLEPVAVLPGRVRKGSRFTGSAPLETRYALRKFWWVNSSSVLS